MKFKKMGLIAPILVIFLSSNLFANFIISSSEILPKKTTDKINQMGKELKEKTGISVYLVIIKDLNGSNIVEYEKNISKNLSKPFVLLSFAPKDKKIDIISSDKLKDKFDKEQILSPWPWSGSILPLLVSHSKNEKAKIEAALLNGYADIVEQLANSYGVKLKSGIGNQNRIVFDILKIIIYGIIGFIFFKLIYRRFKKDG